MIRMHGDMSSQATRFKQWRRGRASHRDEPAMWHSSAGCLPASWLRTACRAQSAPAADTAAAGSGWLARRGSLWQAVAGSSLPAAAWTPQLEGAPPAITCRRWAPGPQRRCGAGAGWGQTRAAHRAPAVEGRGVGSHMLTRLANPAMPGGVYASRTPSKPFSMHRCCCTAQTTLS